MERRKIVAKGTMGHRRAIRRNVDPNSKLRHRGSSVDFIVLGKDGETSTSNSSKYR